MKDKYVAYYGANNESETFQTFEQAEKWLKDQWAEDSDGGFSEESCEGGDYIAEITHRSGFRETENRDKDGYKWDEEAHGYFKDGEEWPYEFDHIGNIFLNRHC